MRKFYFLFTMLLALSWSVALSAAAQHRGRACVSDGISGVRGGIHGGPWIESIAPPRWGALTLVRELGRSHGSQLSVERPDRLPNSSLTATGSVRVSGEVFVPGTMAVVGGRECRFERKRITVLPDSAHCEPQCRLEPDSAAMAAMGGCIVRLVCDRKPSQGRSGAGAGRYAGDLHPVFDGLFPQERAEECIYRYRIDDNSGKHILTPQLSFGGNRSVPLHVVWLAAGPLSEVLNLRRPAGWIVCFAACLFVDGDFRARSPAAGQTPSFPASWQVYFGPVAALLFISGFAACFICGAVRRRSIRRAAGFTA